MNNQKGPFVASPLTFAQWGWGSRFFEEVDLYQKRYVRLLVYYVYYNSCRFLLLLEAEQAVAAASLIVCSGSVFAKSLETMHEWQCQQAAAWYLYDDRYELSHVRAMFLLTKSKGQSWKVHYIPQWVDESLHQETIAEEWRLHSKSVKIEWPGEWWL